MRWLRVYPGERAAVAFAAATLFCIELSDAFTSNAADALYLARRGPAGLGAQLAISSLFLVLTLGVVGTLADRGDRARLLGWLAAAAAGLLGVARVALALAPDHTPAALLVLSKQLAAALDLGFWVLVADRFDARQARRLFPLLLFAGGLGLVAGSFATRPLARLFGVDELFTLGAGASVLAAAGAWALGRGERARPVGLGARPPGLLEAARQGLALARRNELLGRLAIVVGLAGALGPILYYALGATAHAAYPGEESLAAFYGRYRGVTSLAVLAAQAFLAPLALRLAGVGTALAVAPIAAVGAAAALTARPDLIVAAAAQASSRVLDAAVETPGEKLAQNLLARDARGRAAAFLDGVAKRFGALAGGVIVGIAHHFGGRAAGGAALAVSAGWLAAALALRRRYPALAVEQLSARRLDDARGVDDEAPAGGTLIDAGTLKLLRRDLVDAEAARRELAVEAIARDRPDRAVVEYLRAARAATGEARAGLIAAADRVLEAWPGLPAQPAAAEDAVALLDGCEDVKERADLVTALGRLADDAIWSREEARLIGLREGEGEHAAVRLAAAAAIARRGGAAAELDRAVGEALGRARRGDPLRQVAFEEARAEAIAVAAGRSTERDAPRKLLDGLARGADPQERALALDALAQALRGAPREATPAMVLLWRGRLATLARETLDDPLATPTVRAAAARLCAALEDPTLAPALAQALADRDDDTRAAAAAGLAAVGVRALPVLLVSARFGRRAARDAALAILRDLKALPSALDDVIDGELTELHQTALRLHALAAAGQEGASEGGGLRSSSSAALEPSAARRPAAPPPQRATAPKVNPARALLAARLEERVREITRTLLLVVEARLQDRRVGAAARRILGARDSRARAHALEALDAILPRALARRVVDALEEAPLDARAARAAEALNLAAPGASEATRAELAGGDPLARALLVHAVGRSGRKKHRDAIRAAARAGAIEIDPVRLLRRIHLEDEDESDVPSSVEAMILLSGVPLFAELTPSQLAQVAGAARWESVAAGGAVEPGDALLVVQSGRLTGGDGVAHAAGAAIGERAIFGAAPAVRLTAAERTRILRLGREDLEQVIDDTPGIGLALCRALARQSAIG